MFSTKNNCFRFGPFPGHAPAWEITLSAGCWRWECAPSFQKNDHFNRPHLQWNAENLPGHCKTHVFCYHHIIYFGTDTIKLKNNSSGFSRCSHVVESSQSSEIIHYWPRLFRAALINKKNRNTELMTVIQNWSSHPSYEPPQYTKLPHIIQSNRFCSTGVDVVVPESTP